MPWVPRKKFTSRSSQLSLKRLRSMFSKLVGNEHVKHTLRHLLSSDRVPNALLFAGEDGVGKLQFALELARTFICNDHTDGEACGVCSACSRIDKFVIPEPTD